MLLQSLSALVCILAAVLQFAVHRSPDIVDSPLVATARKISTAGLFVAGVYIAYALIHHGGTSTPLCLATGLIGLSQMLCALDHLLLDFEVRDKHAPNP